MQPTESEFYDRLNKLEKEPSMIPAFAVIAISGFIVGFMAGYFTGIIWPIGG